MKKSLITIFFFFTFIIAYTNNNITMLKGKTIVIPPIEKVSLDCFYSPDALIKNKFDKKHRRTLEIFGKNIYVSEVARINQGNDKKDAYIITMNNGEEEFIMYLPLCYNANDTSLYTKFGNSRRVARTFRIDKVVNPDDLEILHYDGTLLDSIIDIYQDKMVYPMEDQTAYYCKDDGKTGGYDSEYVAKIQEPILFKGFEFMDDPDWRSSQNSFKYLYAIFEKNSREYYTKVFPAQRFSFNGCSYETNNCLNLSRFMSTFLPEDKYLAQSASYLDTLVLERIQREIGKEYFLKYDSIRTRPNYPIDSLIREIKHVGNYSSDHLYSGGYYRIKDVKLLPCSNHKPLFHYFVILEDNDSIAFPLNNDFFNIAIDGETQHKIDELRRQENEALSAQRQAQLDREDEQYSQQLIRKFGMSNAKLILNGEVRIGFTKAMCIESWGEPYDINRTITRNGTFEQWVYGLGTYLYFEGNTLTGIQD